MTKKIICLSGLVMLMLVLFSGCQDTSPETTFPFIESVQQPVSSIADPPTIVALNNPLQLAALETGRPASAVLNIDNGLIVSNADNTPLYQVLEAMQGRIIPVFLIEFENAAEEFIQFYNDNNIRDGIVMSSDPAVLLRMREGARHLPGALVVDANDIFDKAILDHWIATANTHKARILYIRNTDSLIPRDAILYMQARMASVWLEICPDDVLQQLLSGPNGLVTHDVSQLYELYEAFTVDKPIILRRPLNVAHRGSPSIIPQNTLEGAIQAFADGADVVELDIMITSDEYLVIFHDNDVGRLTGCPLNRNVWEMTLEEIRELTPNLHGDYIHSAEWHPRDFDHVQIPTMREYMEAFHGDSTKLIFAEIKDSQDTTRYTRIIQEMALLLDEFDMHNQVVFMSFNHESSKYNALRRYLPQIPFAGLNSSATTPEDLIREHVPHNMIPNRRIDGGRVVFDRDMIQALNHRGMPYGAWTYREARIIARDYISGISAMTNSHAHRLSEIPVSFTPYIDILELAVGQSAYITGVITNRHNLYTVVKASNFITINGDEYVSFSENGDIYGVAQGTAVIIPMGIASVGRNEFYLPAYPTVVWVQD